MENVTELPSSHFLPINLIKSLLGNLFTLEKTTIPLFLLAMPNKSSLPISNFLEFIKRACNQGNSSQDNFEGQSLISMLKKYNAKIINKIAFVQGIYIIDFALENNDLVVQQIAAVPILFPNKTKEKSAKTTYRL